MSHYTRKIKLTESLAAKVDSEDYKWLKNYKWKAIKNPKGYYAVRTYYNKEKGNNSMVYMHREILGLTDRKIHGDHKDHDTLNNRRCNLRVVTHFQNMANRSSHKNSTSKFLGVSIETHKRGDKIFKYWHAAICKDRKIKYLGHFKTEEAAALAYNEAAIKLHGQFANLNVIY